MKSKIRLAYEAGLESSGTWARAQGSGKLTALVRCPECRRIASLSGHDIREDGIVHPSLVCPYDDCDFHEYVTLDGWSKENA